MKRSIRFGLQNLKLQIPSMIGMGAMLTLFAIMSGGKGFFYSYYGMLPSLLLFLSAMFGVAFTTTQLNIALSFGELRRNYFKMVQVQTAVVSISCGVIFFLCREIPLWLGMESGNTMINKISIPMLAGCVAVLYLVGGVTGVAYQRGNLLVKIVTTVSAFILSFISILMPIFADIVRKSDTVWGQVFIAIAAVAVAIALICEGILWWHIKSVNVR